MIDYFKQVTFIIGTVERYKTCHSSAYFHPVCAAILHSRKIFLKPCLHYITFNNNMLNTTCWDWHFRLLLDSTSWQVLLNSTLLTCWRLSIEDGKHVNWMFGQNRKKFGNSCTVTMTTDHAKQLRSDIRKAWWTLAFLYVSRPHHSIRLYDT